MYPREYTYLNSSHNKTEMAETTSQTTPVLKQRSKYYILHEDGSMHSPVLEYTVEDAVEHIGIGWFQIKIFFICGLFLVTEAMEMLLLSVLSPELRCEWMLDEWQVALITTVSDHWW